MDFKKILNVILKVLVLIKDKIIFGTKWLFEKIAIGLKWLGEHIVTLCKFIKDKVIIFGNFLNRSFKNLIQKIKDKKQQKKLNASKDKTNTKSTKLKDSKSKAKSKELKESKTKQIKETKTSSKKADSKTAAKKTSAKSKKDEKSEEQKQLEKEQKKKKIIMIVSGIIIIVLLILLLLGIRSCSASSRLKERETIANLAVEYADNSEFDRALDLLDGYIKKHPDDQGIKDLWKQIVDLKKQYDNAVNGNGGNGYDGPITLDTSGLSNALRDALADSNKRADEYQKAAEENRKALEDLKNNMNKNQNGNNGLNGNDSDGVSGTNGLSKEEADRLKAEEEKLGKDDAKLKKQIDNVNDLIQNGKNSLNSGKNDDGIKYFDKATAQMPQIPGNNTFGSSKESDMAQSLYDAAQNAKNPNDKDKLLKEAVKHAQNALKDNPNDARAHNILGQEALGRKDYNTALKELQAAANVKGDPNRYLYYYNLGKVQYTLKKYSDAANSFTMSCDLKSDFAPSRYNLGLTQKQLKNETAALNAFKKTIDIEPRHEKAYLEEARILSARGDYLGSIDAYKNVLQINNVNVQAAMELGSVYYKRNNYQEAEDSYRRAITMLGPSEEMTLTKYNLSTVLYDEDKVDEAVKYAREAYESKNYVKNNNSKANVIYNYALVLDKVGKKDAAIPVYKEVLSYNPEHAKTKINLGNMYMELNPPQVDMAQALFLQVYQNENSNFEANNNLGSVYLLKEEYRNAIKFFQNALRIQPKNNIVRANLAKAYAKNGDYDNAKTTYTDVIKYDKNDWDSYLELAKVCMQLNDNTNAEGYLIYIRDNNPSFKRAEVTNLLNAISVKN